MSRADRSPRLNLLLEIARWGATGGLAGAAGALALSGGGASPGAAAAWAGGGAALAGFAAGLRASSASRQLKRALIWLGRGQEAPALAALRALAGGGVTPRSQRDQAALALGLHALEHGRYAEAESWLARPQGGVVAAFALSARGLLCALDGRAAEALAFSDSARAAGGPAVQGELDTVRLLLVWQAEGPSQATELGERLLTAESGALFRGILAAALRQVGQPARAAEVLDPATAALLDRSGWTDRWPPLRTDLEGGKAPQ
ncbi:MAG: hypothetical protein JXX28_06810 [Deltaproteobacteria bacterium]|nr:hypothetical protein [Deltaproteobacteria bacterium]